MIKKSVAIPMLCAVLLACSFGANAFTCMAQGKTLSGSGTVSVFVTLQPTIQPNENLVVNLGDSIQCKNDAPSVYLDPVRVGTASSYGGALENFTGSLSYFGKSYPFPIPANGATSYVNHTWGTYQPWNAILYLSPTGAAGGVAISQNSLFASLKLEKIDSLNGNVQTIIWNIYAANSVVVPTGGCDVSARNVTVNLPDYPGNQTVPLTVRCAQNHGLSYYVTGTTTDTASTVFANTATSPAQGVGVQLRNKSGILQTHQNVSLGNVGTSPVDLGLSAQYARTGPQVTAGNVQSVIGVTFVYQ